MKFAPSSGAKGGLAEVAEFKNRVLDASDFEKDIELLLEVF